jgi:hypothetical protein
VSPVRHEVGFISHKTTFFIFPAVNTSNPHNSILKVLQVRSEWLCGKSRLGEVGLGSRCDNRYHNSGRHPCAHPGGLLVGFRGCSVREWESQICRKGHCNRGGWYQPCIQLKQARKLTEIKKALFIGFGVFSTP